MDELELQYESLFAKYQALTQVSIIYIFHNPVFLVSLTSLNCILLLLFLNVQCSLVVSIHSIFDQPVFCSRVLNIDPCGGGGHLHYGLGDFPKFNRWSGHCDKILGTCPVVRTFEMEIDLVASFWKSIKMLMEMIGYLTACFASICPVASFVNNDIH